MMVVKQIAGAGDLLISFLVGSLALGALAVFLRRAADGAPFWAWPTQEFPEGWGWLVGVSGWLVASLPLLALATIRKSYSNEASRRKVGIIWDLMTFWPRRFHPLAPPPYSERAVPELQQRLRQATEGEKGVVFATHSQGTVIGFASLLSLEENSLRHIAFMTYGSPLGSYHRRFFPTYFSTAKFTTLESKLGSPQGKASWRNFWRPTDPVAGCVFGEHPIDSELRDKKVLDPWWGYIFPGQPLPHLEVHSDYMDDPTLRMWVRAATDELC